MMTMRERIAKALYASACFNAEVPNRGWGNIDKSMQERFYRHGDMVLAELEQPTRGMMEAASEYEFESGTDLRSAFTAAIKFARNER